MRVVEEDAVRRPEVDGATGVSRGRLAGLFALFFCICCGLGYPSLNRMDWRAGANGLSDVRQYGAMVEGTPNEYPGNHIQFRVLVPSMARVVYRAARGHVGTWDPVMLGLLLVDALFVAATVTLLLLVMMRLTGNYAVALGSALLYLLNFAVPNLRLAGFIDAGEAFFLMAVTWCLLEERYWLLPVLGVAGATAKESFVVFLVVFTAAWWVSSRRETRRPGLVAAWMVGAWAAALAAMMVVQFAVLGRYRSPWEFGIEMRGEGGYLRHFVGSFADRNLWYIFAWLLPMGVVRLGRLPRAWRVATAAASVAAFAMDAYYGGQPGTIGRALFTVAGPLLTASAAMLVFEPKPTGAREVRA